jgi:uncharacterized protein (DUF362 family)
MKSLDSDMTRRQFIKSLTVGGLALYGCSDSPVGYKPPDATPRTTPIVLYKTNDRIAGVKKLLEMLEYPSVQDKNVIVKPNFNTALPAPASTHDDTLGQIVVELNTRGASGITVAERCPANFDNVIEERNLDTLANDLGFQLQNLENVTKSLFHREYFHWQDGFDLPDIIRDAEYIVSTCCLKTHAFGGVFTMSLKLGVGILPQRNMGELHNSPDMRAMIAEINGAYKPKIIIMDGIKAFIQGGPNAGVEATGDVMVAGTDRIAVDAVGAAILKDLGSRSMRGKIFEQDQIKRAVELGLGIQKPSRIEFITPDEASRQYAETLADILAEG